MTAVHASNLPLFCAVATLFILALTNRFEVRQGLSTRLGATPLGLFISALPGRTVVFVLSTMACFWLSIREFPTVPSGTLIGLAFLGAGLGFCCNIAFLAYTVHRAWEALRYLRAGAHAALEEGMVQAVSELDSDTPDKRIWGACMKEADEDPEIAGAYYMRRRARVLAKQTLLTGGRWSDWIPSDTLSPTFRELLGGWDEEPREVRPPATESRAAHSPACAS